MYSLPSSSLLLKVPNIIIACCGNVYKRYYIQKSRNNLFHPSFAIIVFGRNSSFFLLSRINKVDRDFLYRQILTLVCPLKCHVRLLLSHQFARAKMVSIVNKVYSRESYVVDSPYL